MQVSCIVLTPYMSLIAYLLGDKNFWVIITNRSAGAYSPHVYLYLAADSWWAATNFAAMLNKPREMPGSTTSSSSTGKGWIASAGTSVEVQAQVCLQRQNSGHAHSVTVAGNQKGYAMLDFEKEVHSCSAWKIAILVDTTVKLCTSVQLPNSLNIHAAALYPFEKNGSAMLLLLSSSLDVFSFEQSTDVTTAMVSYCKSRHNSLHTVCVMISGLLH